MGITPDSKCRKGDRSSVEENLVERSSTNEKDESISLWKKEDGKFQIACCDDKKSNETDKWQKLVSYQDYEKDDLPWALYEGCCDVYGCSPYPEAEAYYRRKGLLKD